MVKISYISLSRLMPKETDLIKSKLDIVEFLRSYLSLNPAGKNFKALCPFHQEKTPSFIVSPEKQIWHCFGCSEGGDIIKFVMKYENLEFPEALRLLAERAGIPIQTLSPTQQREFGILYDIHNVSTLFFQNELKKNAAAREYLKKRALQEKTIEEFAIGFAPGGETLTLHLLNAGFDINDISRAGLTNKNVRGLYRDRFENRVIFPLHNAVEKVVAFTGRLLEESSNMPKYLNSPETPIFNKSKILYGFHKSKHQIIKSKSAFLVEGQMDFLMAWQSGIQNTIAVSGTGLTRGHLEKARRIADIIIISFDNDEAGLKAVERALDVLGGFDFHVKAIQLGGFKDPAEACEKNPDFIKEKIAKAEPAFTYLLNHYFGPSHDETDILYKKRSVRHLLSKIKNMKSHIEQSMWIKSLHKYSGVGEAALLEELAEISYKRGETSDETVRETKTFSHIDRISERILTLAFANDDFLSIMRENNELLPPSYRETLEDTASDKSVFFKMQSSYEFSDAPIETLRKEFNDLLMRLKMEYFKKKQELLKEEIRKAEKRGDELIANKATEELNALINEMRKEEK